LEWYYSSGAEQVGPISQEAFEQHVTEGRVLNETSVWCTGMADWTTYGAYVASQQQAAPAQAPAATQTPDTEVTPARTSKASSLSPELKRSIMQAAAISGVVLLAVFLVLKLSSGSSDASGGGGGSSSGGGYDTPDELAQAEVSTDEDHVTEAKKPKVARTTKWHTHKAKNDQFTVEIPGKPEVKRLPLDIKLPDGSSVESEMLQYEEGPNAYYAVVYTPALPIPKARVSAALDGGVSGLIRRTKGLLVKKRTIQRAGNPGRSIEWTVKSEGQSMIGKAVAFQIPSGLLLAMHLCKEQMCKQPAIERFLASVQPALVSYPEAKSLLDKGDKIKAIMKIRELSGMSIAAAKAWCDANQ